MSAKMPKNKKKNKKKNKQKKNKQQKKANQQRRKKHNQQKNKKSQTKNNDTAKPLKKRQQTDFKCGNCSKAGANSRCGGCKKIYYCNKQCQRKHWIKHKTKCNFKNSKNENNSMKHNCSVLKCHLFSSDAEDNEYNCLNNSQKMEEERRVFTKFMKPLNLQYKSINDMSIDE
eukprot:108092_1